MNFLNLKSLSVNKAWQGRRYRTDAYKLFQSAVHMLLLVIKPKKPEGDEYFVHYEFGLPSSADIDNPIKTFQDCLFRFWNMLKRDSKIMFMIVVKVKVKKGDEYIGFHVDDRSNLIEYLEDYIRQLREGSGKGEENGNER